MDSTWVALGVASIIQGVRAANITFPWGTLPAEKLQSTGNQISFDPLAFLAILHNPRASGSAARLYNPCHVGGKTLYRWPNTMMVGGALPPFKLLVDHLVSPTQSSHPVIDMCKTDRFDLDIKTDLPIPSDTFPVSHANLWLLDLLAFKTHSEKPQNDLMIISLDTIHGDRRPTTMNADGFASTYADFPWKQAALVSIMLCTTMLLLSSMICSVLYADIWAAVLFFMYLLHDVSSIVVSFRRMVITSDRDSNTKATQKDSKIHFLVHQRPAGGRVVVKARQDTLYSWQLTSYNFNSSRVNNAVHWTWMITGALAAAASVICMVNMAAILQLAYLAILVISSALEIIATQLVRRIHLEAIHYGQHQLLSHNDSWSRALIRSALEVDHDLCLEDVPWWDFGLLPDMKVYENFAAVLPKIRENQDGMAERGKLKAALLEGVTDGYEVLLAERVTQQVLDALQARNDIAGRRSPDQAVQGSKVQSGVEMKMLPAARIRNGTQTRS